MNHLFSTIKNFFNSKKAIQITASVIIWTTITLIAVGTIGTGLYTHMGAATSRVTSRMDAAIQ